MRRGDSHIQEKCTGSAATLSARRRRERHAMRHAVNGKCLDHRLTVCVVPYAARVAPDQFLIRGLFESPCTLVHCRMMSSPLKGFTIGSLVPCHIEIFGHGPRCLDAARTVTPAIKGVNSTTRSKKSCLTCERRSSAR